MYLVQYAKTAKIAYLALHHCLDICCKQSQFSSFKEHCLCAYLSQQSSESQPQPEQLTLSFLPGLGTTEPCPLQRLLVHLRLLLSASLSKAALTGWTDLPTSGKEALGGRIITFLTLLSLSLDLHNLHFHFNFRFKTLNVTAP